MTLAKNFDMGLLTLTVQTKQKLPKQLVVCFTTNTHFNCDVCILLCLQSIVHPIFNIEVVIRKLGEILKHTYKNIRNFSCTDTRT